MKKKLSVIMVLTLVISLLCSTYSSVYATVTSISGRGIVDDTLYYIVNTGNGNHEYLDPVLNQVQYTGSLQATANPDDLYESRYMWKVDKQTDGTYKIRAFGGSGNYLYAQSDMSATIKIDLGNDSLKFDISRVDSGDYQGKYIIKNSGNYMTLSAGNIELYSEPEGAFSYWSFVAVNKGVADCYSYNYTGFNTTNINNDIASKYNSWGYLGFFLENHTPASDILSFITENDISIYAGLGEAGALIINPNATTDNKIMADSELDESGSQLYISSLPSNALANSRCIIYLSSQSGNDVVGNDNQTHNLVTETFDKGAHYVLGFKVDVSDQMAKIWLSAFINRINSNGTIEQAVSAGNSAVGMDLPSNADPDNNAFIYSRGDSSQKLNF